MNHGALANLLLLVLMAGIMAAPRGQSRASRDVRLKRDTSDESSSSSAESEEQNAGLVCNFADVRPFHDLDLSRSGGMWYIAYKSRIQGALLNTALSLYDLEIVDDTVRSDLTTVPQSDVCTVLYVYYVETYLVDGEVLEDQSALVLAVKDLGQEPDLQVAAEALESVCGEQATDLSLYQKFFTEPLKDVDELCIFN